MTSLNSAPAFLTVVGADKTIHLPESVPDGSMVAIFIMPIAWREPEEIRQAHFAAALEEVRAIDPQTTPNISDQALTALVRKVRKKKKNIPQ